MSFENESESTEFEPLNETETFDEAVALIEQTEDQERSESTEQGEPEAVKVDDPERAAKGLVRSAMQGLNWVLRTFKDKRIQYDEDLIKEAESSIAPALVKHGVGSGGVSRYGEEIGAGAFLVMLGINTRSAIVELRTEDEAKRKRTEETEQHG